MFRNLNLGIIRQIVIGFTYNSAFIFGKLPKEDNQMIVWGGKRRF